MEWPLTLDLVLGSSTTATRRRPRPRRSVDREFVEDQRNELGIVAETIRDLATRGVPVDAGARPPASGPGPRERLEPPYAVGYEQLPRCQKRLPLI